MGRFGKFTIVVLVVLSALVFAGAVAAEWKVVNVIEAWDNAAQRWESGNATMYLDGSPQSFYHTLIRGDFDKNQYPNACGARGSSPWAGMGEIGLYHTDTDADNNAPGFQATSGYRLVPCGELEGNPDTEIPPTTLADCPDSDGDGELDRCEIFTQDVVTTCSTGNCKDEIVTSIGINLDTDCDGALDTGFTDEVCLFWQAEKPPFPDPGDPVWEGNIQVRVAAGGGEKTVNFGTIKGPNAVFLQSLIANPITGISMLVVLTVLVLLVGTAVALVQRVRHA